MGLYIIIYLDEKHPERATIVLKKLDMMSSQDDNSQPKSIRINDDYLTWHNKNSTQMPK